MPPTLATLNRGQLEALRHLAKLGSAGATVTLLAEHLQRSRSTTGSQVNVLHDANLIIAEVVPGKPQRWLAVDAVRYLVTGRRTFR